MKKLRSFLKIGRWLRSKTHKKGQHSLKEIREKQDQLNARLDKLEEMEQQLKDSIR